MFELANVIYIMLVWVNFLLIFSFIIVNVSIKFLGSLSFYFVNFKLFDGFNEELIYSF